MAIFLNQKRAYVCEHTIKMVSLCRVFIYIRSLLIEKDGHDRQNILIKFPCVYVCLSYGDLFNFCMSFHFPFPYFEIDNLIVIEICNIFTARKHLITNCAAFVSE